MKKNGLLKIIAIIAGVLLILSWIIPASYFSGEELVDIGLYRVGLFDIFNYPILAIQYFIQLLLLILTIGGFYGILSETGRYRSTLEKIAKFFKGKEIIFLIASAFILAVLSSLFGLGVFLFIFIPALCGIIMIMGYDKITAMLSTFVAIMVGVIGSTFNPYVSGYILQYLGKISAGANNVPNYLDGLIVRIILFVLTFAVYMLFTLLYAKKHKSELKASDIEQTIPYTGEKKKSKVGSWLIFLIFGLILVVLILSTTDWVSLFNVSFFSDLMTKIKEWEIGNHTVASYVLGTVNEFGKWYYSETIIILLISSIIIGLSYKVDNIFNTFKKGVENIIKPAFLVIFAMVVVIITAYHPFYMTITDWIINLASEFNLFLTSIVTVIGSIFNVEVIYLAQSEVAYLAGTFTSQTAVNTIAVIVQSFYGLTMLVAPTSTMLILGLEFLNIPYIEWIKKSWKLILSLLAIILIVIIMVMLIYNGTFDFVDNFFESIAKFIKGIF